MAVIQPTTEKVNSRLLMKGWGGITENDTTEAYESAGFVDRTVQIFGTFGGATITIEGSNNDAEYSTLTSFTGTALSATSALGVTLIAEAPRFIRVGISGGSSTNVNVIIANSAVSM